MLRLLTALAVGAALVMAAMAVFVRRRGGSASGGTLAVLLLSAAWWAGCYAMELSTTDLDARGRWGDLKYIGVGILPPAFLVFVAQYTGRRSWLTSRRRWLLAIEPVLVWVLLAIPATHDLIRYYARAPVPGEIPLVAAGPLFWVSLIYANVLLLMATVLFLRSMLHLSRTYRVAALVLIGAALLPWAANLLYNLGVGPFARVDLTPLAFTVTGAVLVAGLYRERLIDLSPVGWGLAVATMPDAVLLCDAFGHVSDANPAATDLLGHSRSHLVGRDLASLVPQLDLRTPREGDSEVELTLALAGLPRSFEVHRHDLPGPAGSPSGQLVMLRDVTQRRRNEAYLRRLLDERTRIAETLRSSLLPAHLPAIPGCSLAGLHEPAGGPHEVAGDFYDVFPIDGTRWGLVLGDVSGKGAEAGAVTALIRWTVRTLALAEERPSAVLRRLNDILLRDLADEQYCTIVFGITPEPSRAADAASGLPVTLSLGGHYQPLLRHGDARVEPVGVLGTALGLVEDPSLCDSTVVVGPGELLCLFTDGLVEARAGDAFLGTDGVCAALARGPGSDPARAADHLAAAAHDFRQGPLTDDLALLVLSVP